MKKKIVAILLIAIIAASAVFTFKSGILSNVSGKSDDSSQIYVTPLNEIMGEQSSYTPEVFMGVVEVVSGCSSPSFHKSISNIIFPICVT